MRKNGTWKKITSIEGLANVLGGHGVLDALLIHPGRTVVLIDEISRLGERKKQIGHDIIEEVAEKVRRLKYDKALSVRTALVYDGELAKSVPADRYFDFIVPAGTLLT